MGLSRHSVGELGGALAPHRQGHQGGEGPGGQQVATEQGGRGRQWQAGQWGTCRFSWVQTGKGSHGKRAGCSLRGRAGGAAGGFVYRLKVFCGERWCNMPERLSKKDSSGTDRQRLFSGHPLTLVRRSDRETLAGGLRRPLRPHGAPRGYLPHKPGERGLRHCPRTLGRPPRCQRWWSSARG